MSIGWLYILASKRYGTLYVGVTNDLMRRVYEQREDLIEGFTKQYNVKQLVYYEEHENISNAILREKQIKEWQQKWKIELIQKLNSKWLDLYDSLM
jgi:putative endonuclease